MVFHETTISGVFVVELARRADERGSLARIWDRQEFLARGIEIDLVEGYTTHSPEKGTVRGIHYQVPPRADCKWTRTLRGAIYELVVDLREDSPTYREFEGFEFHENDNKMLLVPQCCGHGIQTLKDETQLMSFSTAPYSREHERGIRYDDAAFDFPWPVPVTRISSKDLAWNAFEGQTSHDRH